MKLQTQRWIDQWAGQALCAALSVWARLFERATPSQADSANAALPREAAGHVLVIMLSEMGSMVLAGPMFARIKARYPGAQLHVLQLKKNREVSLLLGLAPPQNLHVLDDSSPLRLARSIWQVSRRLRALPLDGAIDCELFSRISALMSYFVGAPLRAGFSSHTQEGLYRGSFINRAIPYNPYRHISQQFVALVDALSSETMPRSKVAPLLPPARGASALGGLAVPFAPAELAQYQARLLAAHPTLEGRQRVLVYAGGGLLPERAWPEAHYTALVRGLCEAGHAVGLIGLADDRALASRIHAGVGSAQCADLTGYTGSIRELLMLFHSAQLLVTNDGGPGHFASLTPIEVFMFFGPETSRLYGPLGTVCAKPPTVFDLQWPCSPCLSAYNHRQTFCDGDNQCLKQIAPHTVLALALTALAAPAQGAGA